MATDAGGAAPIGVASLVSNEMEDEGLLAVIRSTPDMVVRCHTIMTHVPPGLSSFQLCDWDLVEVIVMILPTSIVEDAVSTFIQAMPHIPLVAAINSPWSGPDIVRIIQEGAAALTTSMRANVIVNMMRLAYYHAGAVDLDMSQSAIRTVMALGPHTTSLNALDREIWSLVAKGYSNAQISAMLGISLSRTKHRIKHIFRYLDVHHRTQAIKLYDENRNPLPPPNHLPD